MPPAGKKKSKPGSGGAKAKKKKASKAFKASKKKNETVGDATFGMKNRKKVQ
jgi:hypothetical protein